MSGQMALPMDARPNGSAPVIAPPRKSTVGKGAGKEDTTGASAPAPAVFEESVVTAREGASGTDAATRPDVAPTPPDLVTPTLPAEGQRDPGEERERRDLHGALVTLGLWAVRLVAALVSYEHMRELASTAGEGWRAWLLPVSVDGLAVVALAKIRRAPSPVRDGWARLAPRGGGMAWLALVLSLGVSVAANVAAAEPTAIGRAVAGWSPIALLLAEVVDNRRASTPAIKQESSGGGAGLETVRPSPGPTPREVVDHD